MPRLQFPLQLVLLLLAAAGAPVPRSVASDGDWHWPLELQPRAITGTFMEPRSAHWHAGLDIRTGGRVGAEVRAPVGGWISRLRTSPHGYGKAVYLRTAEDLTLVFAHLEAFASPLHEHVLQAQGRSGRYAQDLWLEPGEIEVEAGQLLALSGATGTGAPHLHFEVRGADGRPRDPQVWLPASDVRGPEVRRIRLLPMDEGARLEGRARPCRVAAGDTVVAAGTLAVQVDAVDRTGTAPFPVMPRGFELRVDGRRVYRLEQIAYEFSQGRQMQLEIASDPDDGDRGRWLRLYGREGNTLAGREGNGRLHVTPDGGTRTLEVVAWDIHGHRDSLRVYVRGGSGRSGQGALGGRRVPGPSSARDATSSPPVEIFASEAVVEIVEPGQPVTARSLATLGSGAHLLPRVDGGFLEIALLTGSGSIAAIAAPRSPVRLTDRTGSALFPGGALWLQEVETGVSPTSTLTPVGPVAELRGAGAALRMPLEVEVDLPAETPDPTRLLLYRIDGRGRWSALPTRADQRGPRLVLTGELDRAGVVVAARDTVAPRFGAFVAGGRALRDGQVLEPIDAAGGAVPRPRWPVVSIALGDSGSGLEESGPVLTLNGRIYPARWDPEEELLRLELFLDPGPGTHEIVVGAVDRAGNRAARSIRLELRDGG